MTPAALSSWKEIAAYLGKGVRTVQRWEQEMALPVRRPKHGGKGVVLAMPEELDAWLHSQPLHALQEGAAGQPDLSGTMAKLERENASLRQQLHRLVQEAPVDEPPHAGEENGLAHNDLSDECSRLLHASTNARLDCAESLEIARNIRSLRSLQNHSAGNRPLFQAQISVMLTCCAIADDDLRYGRVEAARQLVQRLRRVCESIQIRLSEAQLPDDRTNLTQEELRKLQTRILTIESRFAA